MPEMPRLPGGLSHGRHRPGPVPPPRREMLHAFFRVDGPDPENLAPPSPECLIGCLKCQLVCPENSGRVKYEKAPVVFSAEETQALLDLAEGSEAGLDKIQDKIRELGLSEIPAFTAATSSIC